MSASAAPSVRWLLLLSALFLAAQVALTDYGAESERAVAVLWFVIGGVLLWVTYRLRSRVAWGFLVVTALLGAFVYALGALESARAGLLAVLYVGQAVPLLTGPVRRHVSPTGS